MIILYEVVEKPLYELVYTVEVKVKRVKDKKKKDLFYGRKRRNRRRPRYLCWEW